MRGLGMGEGIMAALKADTLSLTAFELGLFGGMAIIQFVLFRSVTCIRTARCTGS